MNETLPTEKMLIGLTVLQAGCLSARAKVNFPSPDTGWAVGAGGTIIKTTDGGETWIHQTSETLNDTLGVYFLGL